MLVIDCHAMMAGSDMLDNIGASRQAGRRCGGEACRGEIGLTAQALEGDEDL